MKIIGSAVCVFNAVKVLKETFEKHSTHEAEHDNADKLSLITSIGILGFLGIEIGLKALIESQGQKPCQIHDLKKLDEDLSSGTKTRLNEKLIAHVRSRDLPDEFKDWDRFIDYNRNGFVFWRYSWEDKPDQPRLIDPDMILAVLWVIIDTHAELYPNDVTDGDSSASAVKFIASEIDRYKRGGS